MRELTSMTVQVIALIALLCGSASVGAEGRDGTWLHDSAREYLRSADKAPNQGAEEINSGTLALMYVRGVLDNEDLKALGAVLFAGAIATNNPKHSDEYRRGVLAGITSIAPLWETDFFLNEMKPEQFMRIIVVYLEKHPEKWKQGAGGLIEEAMRDAFPPKGKKQ
jgi:hypothetical protein